MIRQIPNVEAIAPPPEGSNRADNYLRCKLDSYALISGRDGDVYARKDGAKWEYPAYKITRERNDTVTIEPCGAYADDERFPAVA